MLWVLPPDDFRLHAFWQPLDAPILVRAPASMKTRGSTGHLHGMPFLASGAGAAGRVWPPGGRWVEPECVSGLSHLTPTPFGASVVMQSTGGISPKHGNNRPKTQKMGHFLAPVLGPLGWVSGYRQLV